MAGRPPKFETPEQLDALIDEYLDSCDPQIVKTKVKRIKADGSHYWADDEEISEGEPKTITGLAFFLGIDRRTLQDYKEKPEFLPSIRRALAACESYAEKMLFTGRNANGASFSLKNNYDWVDKTVVDNNNRTVAEDLDDLDSQKADVAAAAAKATGEAGSPPQE